VIRWAAAISLLLLCSWMPGVAMDRFLAVRPRVMALGVNPYNAPSDDTPKSMTFYPGEGLQIEAGITDSDWMLFVGANHDDAHKSEVHDFMFGNDHQRHEDRQQWLSDRFVLGLRLHPSYQNPNRVKPQFGIHASYGWVRRSVDEQFFEQFGDHFHTGSAHASQTSHGILGYGAELGFVISGTSPVALSLAGQIDHLQAAINHDSEWIFGQTTSANVFAFQIGLEYRFCREKVE